MQYKAFETSELIKRCSYMYSKNTSYHYNWSTDISSTTIGIQTFRLPTHGPTIHSTDDGNHSDRNSRAPAGRCKVVQLQPPGFYF